MVSLGQQRDPQAAEAEKEAAPVSVAHDNLAAMAGAANYNAAILNHLLCWVRGQRLLDFGAGDGRFAEKLRALGHQVKCLEPDEHYPADARLLLDLRGESFETIYALNVLEHIGDDEAALWALRQRLLGHGHLYLFCPAFPILYGNMDKLAGHYRRYTKRELLSKLRWAGFRVDHIEYFDSLGFLAGLLYKILGGSGKLSLAQVRFYDRWIFPPSRLLDKLLSRLIGKNLIVVAQCLTLSKLGKEKIP